MSRHHPDSLILMEYSAGSLSEPHALCIRLHLDQCAQCRSQVDALDSLGAVMMEQQPQVSVSSSAFDNIMARIDSEPASSPVIPSVPARPLNKLLGGTLNQLNWKRQLGGLSTFDLSHRFPGQTDQVILQKLCAGSKALTHTHGGQETSLVLQGAYSDKSGIFHQWDYVVLGQDDEHRPVALEGADCITLSILSAPLKLTGTFSRLLNPFIR